MHQRSTRRRKRNIPLLSTQELIKKRQRALLFESLESRLLLNGDWQNPFADRDVSEDKAVTPIDALIGINEINQPTIIASDGLLPDRVDHPDSPLYDVNGDGFLTGIDIIRVINALNEDDAPPTLTVSLGHDSGPRGTTDSDGISFTGLLSGEVTDDLTGISRFEYSVNGVDYLTAPFDSDGTFSFEPTALGEGEHTIMLRASDGLAQMSEAVPIHFTLDTQAPSIAFDNSGPYVTRDNVQVTGQLTDDFAGVESLLAQIDLADVVDVPLDENGNFTFTASLPTDSSADGQHIVRFRATDNAGNLSTLATVDWQFDTQPPQLTSTADGLLRNNIATFDIDFGEPMSAAAFDVTNYVLSNTSGPNSGQTVSIDDIEQVDNVARINLTDELTNGSYQLVLSPAVADAAGNAANPSAINFTIEQPTSVLLTSPANGEDMVNIAREAVVRFTAAVAPTTVTSESFYAIANNERLAASLFVSNTEEYAKLSFTPALPASTEIRIVVDGNQILGRDGLALDADGDGNPGGIKTADFSTVPNIRIPNTIVRGRVIASEPDAQGNDVPLAGVTIRTDGLPEANAVTDANGEFTLADAPAPEFFVHIDGTTATQQGSNPVPAGGHYPSVGKLFHSVPGETLVKQHDIHLPYIPDEAFHEITPGESMVVQLPPSQVEQDPEMANVQLTITANSLKESDGTLATQVGIFRVDSDRLPGPLPDGLSHAFDITVQAEEGAFFDVPAPIAFPNVEGKEPGEQMLLMSFDHAIAEWIVVGSMTAVDEDGDGVAEKLLSNEGVGIRAPGWHGPQNGSPGDSGPPRRCPPPTNPLSHFLPWGPCAMRDVANQLAPAFKGALGRANGEGTEVIQIIDLQTIEDRTAGLEAALPQDRAAAIHELLNHLANDLPDQLRALQQSLLFDYLELFRPTAPLDQFDLDLQILEEFRSENLAVGAATTDALLSSFNELRNSLELRESLLAHLKTFLGTRDLAVSGYESTSGLLELVSNTVAATALDSEEGVNISQAETAALLQFPLSNDIDEGNVAGFIARLDDSITTFLDGTFSGNADLLQVDALVD